MGCSTSKLDSLPAVALCRDRCAFVDDALHHSYAFADAHVAYARSLRALGLNLHQFFGEDGSDVARRPDPPSNPPPQPDRSPSSTTSDSHIQFDSDSDDEDGQTDSDSLNKNVNDYFNQQNMVSSPDTFGSRSYRHNYVTYNGQIGANGDWPQSKTPPPPPPPMASNSAWDFLNFFEPFEKYEPPYSPPDRDRTKQVTSNTETSKKKPENANGSKAAGPTHKPEEDDLAKKKTIPVVAEKEPRSAETDSKTGQSGQRCVSEVMRQVQAQFERASDSGHEVSEMFDTGRYRYHQKHSVSPGI